MVSTTLIDYYRATVINSHVESYRLKEKRQASAALVDAVNSKETVRKETASKRHPATDADQTANATP